MRQPAAITNRDWPGWEMAQRNQSGAGARIVWRSAGTGSLLKEAAHALLTGLAVTLIGRHYAGRRTSSFRGPPSTAQSRGPQGPRRSGRFGPDCAMEGLGDEICPVAFGLSDRSPPCLGFSRAQCRQDLLLIASQPRR